MVDKLIDILKNKKAILFCGAGVSYNSGAPTVKPLTKYILENFDIRADHIERYLNLNYPFEGFIERLRNHIDIKSLLDVFNVENPNLNHFFVAKCLKEGLIEIVITTNFDINFELALAEEKVHYEKIFQPEDLDRIDFLNGISKLVKIHGSIEDKDGVGIEINLIASSKHKEKLRDVINFVFLTGTHDYIIFIGYSFSDKFDVLPLINEFSKSKKRIIVIDHAGDIPDYDFFNIFEDSQKNKINTDNLIQNLHGILFGVPKPLSFKSFNWNGIVDNWLVRDLKNTGLANKLSIAIDIFERTGFSEITNFYIDSALALLPTIDDDIFKCDIYARAASKFRASTSEVEINISIKYLINAIKFAEKAGVEYESSKMTHKGSLAMMYINLGEIYGTKGDAKKSVENFRKGSDILIKVVKYYENHLSSDCSIHILQGYCGYSLNLGLYFRMRKKYNQAIKTYEKIVDITGKRASDVLNEVRCKALHNLGVVFKLKSDYTKCIVFFLSSYHFAKDIRSVDRMKVSFEVIMDFYETRGLKLEKANFFESESQFFKDNKMDFILRDLGY